MQKYISDLLYRYDCVTVPNFGGFVSTKISATLNSTTHTFYPPKKQISFNAHLKNNDGLLANYIASSMDVSYEGAVNYIVSQVKEWNAILEKDILELENIGYLSKNLDAQLIFEPNSTINYLTSSFGLDNFHSPIVKRLEYKKEVAKLKTVVPLIPSEAEKNKRKTPVFLKYAAAIAIIATLGSFGWNAYQQNTGLHTFVSSEKQQEIVNEKIQKATFEIPQELPIISLHVTKEIKKYHIIAGAFRESANATKKVHQLKKQGFDAQVIGTNKWHLTEVTYQSYSSKEKAIKSLRHIKRTVSRDAWLLVKEL